MTHGGRPMHFLRMADLELRGKRVLIREDLNVPLADGQVTSDARIRAALPTLQLAQAKGARVMVMSHLGRPTEGQFDPAQSLAPVAERLTALLGSKVRLVRDWLDGVEVAPGEVVLCENVRFNQGEKKDDEALSKRMASKGYGSKQTLVGNGRDDLSDALDRRVELLVKDCG